VRHVRGPSAAFPMEEKHGTGSCGILLHCNIHPALMSNELAKRYGMIPIVLRIVHKDDVSPWRIALIHRTH
jgi:hypothetical protein